MDVEVYLYLLGCSPELHNSQVKPGVHVLFLAGHVSKLSGVLTSPLKCTYRQFFLLAILNLGMFSILSVQKFFDLDKSFVFYGRLKFTKVHFLMNLVRCYEKSGTSLFRDVIQGTPENRLLMQIHFILTVSHLHCARFRRIKNGE